MVRNLINMTDFTLSRSRLTVIKSF